MTRNATILLVLPFLLAACATAPKPLQGEYPEFYPDQVTERSVSAVVRWGGTIVESQPETDRTCLEILARELDYELRPRLTDDTRGRFLACREGFLEPAVFSSGREITVIGRITGMRDGQVGEFPYRYPQLDAEVVYLWSGAQQSIYGPYYPVWYPYYYDPFWPHFHHPHHAHARFRMHGAVRIIR